MRKTIVRGFVFGGIAAIISVATSIGAASTRDSYVPSVYDSPTVDVSHVDILPSDSIIDSRDDGYGGRIVIFESGCTRYYDEIGEETDTQNCM